MAGAFPSTRRGQRHGARARTGCPDDLVILPAAAGIDFTTGFGTLTFALGQTMQTVVVVTLDDALTEGNEARDRLATIH